MGQACAQVDKVEPGNSSGGATGSSVTLNNVKFGEVWERGGGNLSKNARASEVRNRISSQLGVCLRLPKKTAPMDDIQAIKDRVDSIQNLDHQHIVKLIEAFEEPSAYLIIYQKPQKPTFLIDWLLQKSSVFGQDGEVLTATWALPLLKAMSAVHFCDLVHGAISMDKIIMENGTDLKLQEVGLVDVLLPDPLEALEISGLAYMAPELLQGRNTDWLATQVVADVNDMGLASPRSKAGRNSMMAQGEDPRAKRAAKGGRSSVRAQKMQEEGPLGLEDRLEVDKPAKTKESDVWAIGCMIAHACTGCLPFGGADCSRVFNNVNEGSQFLLRSVEVRDLTPGLQDLLGEMVQDNPKKRTTAEKVINHKFFADHAPGQYRPGRRKSMIATSVVENLRTFAKDTSAKKATLRLIASQIPKSKVKHLVHAFNKLDDNGDGLITFDELKKGLTNHPELGEVFQGANVQDIFNELDFDGSGFFSINEFLAATVDEQSVLTEDVLWQAFKTFDRDGSGKIAVSEIGAVIREVDGIKDVEELKARMYEIQKDIGTGELSYEDFVALMREEGGKGKRPMNAMIASVLHCGDSCTMCTVKGKAADGGRRTTVGGEVVGGRAEVGAEKRCIASPRAGGVSPRGGANASRASRMARKQERNNMANIVGAT